MKTVLLVVLYKQTISTSATIASFCTNCTELYNKVKLIIWDNSPINNNNFASLSELGIEYEYSHSPENLSLAKIYNKVISNLKSDSIVHIFDQDTNLTMTYFNLIYEAVKNEPDISLFVPYVLHETQIMSPGKYKYYKGAYNLNLSLGRISSKNTICIASGMTIRASVLEKVKFDENLKLYGIDSKFSLDYSKCYEYLYVINYSLSHNLSQFEIESYTIKYKRLKSLIKASRYIALKQSGILAYIICTIITSLKLLIFQSKRHLKI